MKKILLASSALVLVAGVAAAEVTVSGDGRMGILYGEDDFTNRNTNEDKDYAFTSRIRISFNASGESDGGLVFGGSVRADNYEDDQATNGQEGSVFVSGTYGRLAMGDVDGGAESVVGDLAGVGLTGLGDNNETFYLFGAGDPNALYQYTTGPLSLALGIGDDEEYSVGIGYDGGTYSVGIGYEGVPAGFDLPFDLGDADDDAQHLAAAASVTFQMVTLKGLYGRLDTGTDDINQYGVSVDASFGPASASAYYRNIELDDDDADDQDFYGVGVEYDLGGGAALAAGLVDGEEIDTTADFGIKFAF